MLHNETTNVWTHLLAAFYFLWLFILIINEHLKEEEA